MSGRRNTSRARSRSPEGEPDALSDAASDEHREASSEATPEAFPDAVSDAVPIAVPSAAVKGVPDKALAVDENALFKKLVESHSSRLYRFILKHIGNTSDAEELAQQAFVEAVQAYRTFRGESQLSTWLYGIAMNLVRNYLSRSPHRRYQMADESVLEDISEADMGDRTVNDPEAQYARSQLFKKMDEALVDMPDHMRELLMLVGVEALTYEEAAVLLTVPIGTVRSRLSRARKTLNERLEASGLKPDASDLG